MKRLILITTAMLFLILVFTQFRFNISNVNAKENKDEVVLITDMRKSYSLNYKTYIDVIFLKEELYNSNVYLSYHVYDDEGNIIQSENPRVPIKINKDGKARVQVEVDITNLDKSLKKSKLIVKYDLVDEKNAYWFSDTLKDTFSTDFTEVEDNSLLNAYTTIRNEIKDHYVIFIINVLVLLCAVRGLIKLRKSQLFM